MKQLPTFALLLITVFGCVQSVTAQRDRTSKPVESGTAHYGFPGERLPDTDTVKVLYLLADTTKHPYPWGERSDKTFRYETVFYRFGYVVERKESDQWNESFWMVAVAYLDENKRPLPRSYVIWQIRSIKPNEPPQQ